MLDLITHEKNKKNVQGMSSVFIDTLGQSSLKRFLVRSNWNESYLNTKRTKLFVEDRCDGILVLDDSLIEKTGKLMEEGVGYILHQQRRQERPCPRISSPPAMSMAKRSTPYTSSSTSRKRSRQSWARNSGPESR